MRNGVWKVTSVASTGPLNRVLPKIVTSIGAIGLPYKMPFRKYQTPPTRNGNRVVYVIMEDGTGIADVTVFSDVQQTCGDVLFKEGWLIVEGKIQKRGPKALSIIAEKIFSLNSKHNLSHGL